MDIWYSEVENQSYCPCWSFDADRQFLTLRTSSRTVVVAVAREADWEASPRVKTIVYAGTEKTMNATWWGKKVSD